MTDYSIYDLRKIDEAYRRMRNKEVPSHTIVTMNGKDILRKKKNAWILDRIVRLITEIESENKKFDKKLGLSMPFKKNNFMKWIRDRISTSKVYILFDTEFSGEPTEKHKSIAMCTCTTCKGSYEDTYSINDVIVDKKYRGKGYGRRILEYVMATNAPLVPTLGVAEMNEPAKALYDKLGFTPISHWMVLRKSERKSINESLEQDFEEAQSLGHEPPWSMDQIRQNEPQWYEQLKKCPIHKWRAETGIELIHKEPTRSEFDRIWRNWNRMTDEMKRVSDEKSVELFGVPNRKHYFQLLKEYNGND